MYKVMLTSKWIGTGTARNPFRPKLVDDYPLISYSDRSGVTKNAGNLNTATQFEVTCDGDQLATLQADPDYTILSSEAISQE